MVFNVLRSIYIINELKNTTLFLILIVKNKNFKSTFKKALYLFFIQYEIM